MKTSRSFCNICLLTGILNGCNVVLDIPSAYRESGGNGGEASGGENSSGGTKAKGGTSSRGGTSAKGSTTNKGGNSSKGGDVSTGGTTNDATTFETGGTTGVGGATTTGGSSSPGGNSSSGGITTTGGTTSTVVATPVITSFTVDYNKVCSGNNATLRAVFSNGTGTISGLGSVSSGVDKVTGVLTADTSYTLTVTNSKGEKVEATVDVTALPSGKFTRTGNLNTARYWHTATLLNDGRVLVVGGGLGHVEPAEIYDLNSGAFSVISAPIDVCDLHTATMLPSGKVVLVGCGLNAEIFDPSNNTFSTSGALKEPRYSHSAVYLSAQERVLVVGGWWGGETVKRNTAELFNLSSGTNGEFVASIKLPNDLTDNVSVLLSGGSVLSVGIGGNNMLYEPTIGTNGTFTATSVVDGPTCFTERNMAISLSDGTALVATSPLEIITNNFSIVKFTQTLNPTRKCPTMTLLQDGKVLVTGGTNDATAAIADPFVRTITSAGNMTTIRVEHTTTLLKNGAVLIAGGKNPGTDSPISTAELYCP